MFNIIDFARNRIRSNSAAGSEISLDRNRNVTTTLEIAPGEALNAKGASFDEHHIDD